MQKDASVKLPAAGQQPLAGGPPVTASTSAPPKLASSPSDGQLARERSGGPVAPRKSGLLSVSASIRLLLESGDTRRQICECGLISWMALSLP